MLGRPSICSCHDLSKTKFWGEKCMLVNTKGFCWSSNRLITELCPKLVVSVIPVTTVGVTCSCIFAICVIPVLWTGGFLYFSRTLRSPCNLLVLNLLPFSWTSILVPLNSRAGSKDGIVSNGSDIKTYVIIASAGGQSGYWWEWQSSCLFWRCVAGM